MNLDVISDCIPQQGFVCCCSHHSEIEQVNYDLVTMCPLGGIERTKNQWQGLLSQAGLVLRGVIRHDSETSDSIRIIESGI